MKSALRARSGVAANGHVPISPLAGVFIGEVTVAPSVTASRDTSPEGGGKGSERLHSFISVFIPPFRPSVKRNVVRVEIDADDS